MEGHEEDGIRGHACGLNMVQVIPMSTLIFFECIFMYCTARKPFVNEALEDWSAPVSLTRNQESNGEAIAFFVLSIL